MRERERLVRLLREGSQPIQPDPPSAWDGAARRFASTEGLPAEGIRAVLFDIYGTLFVSASGEVGSAAGSAGSAPGAAGAAGFEGALALLLRRYGAAMTPRDLLEARDREIRRQHAARTGVDHPEVRIERVWRAVLGPMPRRLVRRFAVEVELLTNPVWPMPHARELIDSLSARGMVIGLVSNAQFYTPLLFEAFWGLSDARIGFARGLRLYSYRLGRAKPSRRLFDLARRRLARRGIPPDRVLLVGNDMLNDVLPASQAGFRTCLFAGDRRSLRLREGDERCAGLAPSVAVSGLRDLALLLGLA